MTNGYRDVDVDGGDEGERHAAAHDERIAERMGDGDVAIDGDGDHEQHGRHGAPQGDEVAAETGVRVAHVRHVEVERHVEGQVEADAQVGDGQRRHQLVGGRSAHHRKLGHRHDHQQVAADGQHADHRHRRRDLRQHRHGQTSPSAPTPTHSSDFQLFFLFCCFLFFTPARPSVFAKPFQVVSSSNRSY